MMKKSLEERIKAAVAEEIEVVPYDNEWPVMFMKEAAYLKNRLPKRLVKRIEHFGSTAVPGLAAKPVIDMLVEVSSLKDTQTDIVPILEDEGYDYFWRPEIDGPPYYAWFIKRNSEGVRTHHIHMVEASSTLWDRLYFRDYLLKFPELAQDYADLKKTLAGKFPGDRVAYTKGKTDFVLKITRKAKEYFSKENLAFNKKESIVRCKEP